MNDVVFQVETLPAIMTAAEVAQHFKVSEWYVNELARQGKLSCLQFGRARRFITSEVIACTQINRRAV